MRILKDPCKDLCKIFKRIFVRFFKDPHQIFEDLEGSLQRSLQESLQGSYKDPCKILTNSLRIFADSITRSCICRIFEDLWRIFKDPIRILWGSLSLKIFGRSLKIFKDPWRSCEVFHQGWYHVTACCTCHSRLHTAQPSRVWRFSFLKTRSL